MKSVCVYLGSNYGTRPEYEHAASALGREMASRGIRLIYGGASKGLMGVLADSTLAHGGTVTGVVPRVLVEREVAHTALTEQHVVDSMHERKALMAELSDGFVALPGGLGTMDEFFEVLTWTQLGLHSKPCGLLDVADYFRHLSSFLDSITTEGFVTNEHRKLVLSDQEPGRLLDKMIGFEPVTSGKWMDHRPAVGGNVA